MTALDGWSRIFFKIGPEYLGWIKIVTMMGMAKQAETLSS